jgi:hypothetical protein
MPKQKRSTGKGGKTGFVLGRAGFTKSLSAEEYRKAIVRSYRKA